MKRLGFGHPSEATLGATALRSMGAHTMSYEHFADSARAQPHLLGVHLWSARSEQPRGQFSEPTTSPSPPCPRVPASHPTVQPAQIPASGLRGSFFYI